MAMACVRLVSLLVRSGGKPEVGGIAHFWYGNRVGDVSSFAHSDPRGALGEAFECSRPFEGFSRTFSCWIFQLSLVSKMTPRSLVLELGLIRRVMVLSPCFVIP